MRKPIVVNIAPPSLKDLPRENTPENLNDFGLADPATHVRLVPEESIRDLPESFSALVANDLKSPVWSPKIGEYCTWRQAAQHPELHASLVADESRQHLFEALAGLVNRLVFAAEVRVRGFNRHSAVSP